MDEIKIIDYPDLINPDKKVDIKEIEKVTQWLSTQEWYKDLVKQTEEKMQKEKEEKVPCRRAFDLEPGDFIWYIGYYEVKGAKVIDDFQEPIKFRIGVWNLSNGEKILKGHDIYDSKELAMQALLKDIENEMEGIKSKINNLQREMDWKFKKYKEVKQWIVENDYKKEKDN